jgi:hypothetical protein
VRWLSSPDDAADVARLFAGFTAWAPSFRNVIDAAGGPPRAQREKELRDA